jgi:hypothetical protein
MKIYYIYIMRIIVTSLILFLFSSNLFANIDFFRNSTWLCIEEMTTGFNWDRENLKWNKANFKPNKYLFKTVNDNKCSKEELEGYFYEMICAQVYFFGEEPYDFNYSGYKIINSSESIDYPRIRGENSSSRFDMSSNGDFTFSFNAPGASGYGIELGDKKNYKDSTWVSVGSCSKI